MDEEIPQEIREKIIKMLERSGKTKQFEEKLTIGAKNAIIHEKTGKETISVVNKFANASESELLALQYIYSYLKKKNLAYTLSTILIESQIQDKNQQYDLSKVIEYISKPRDEEESSDLNFIENSEDDEIQPIQKDFQLKKGNAKASSIDNNNNAFSLDSNDDIITEDLTPKKPITQKADEFNLSEGDGSDFLLSSDSDNDDNIGSQPKKSKKQSTQPKKDVDEFDNEDFEVISDDYVAQGTEITQVDFNKNNIIAKISDL